MAYCTFYQMCSTFDQMCAFNQLAYLCGISSRFRVRDRVTVWVWVRIRVRVGISVRVRVMVRALIKIAFARCAAHLVKCAD